MDIDGEDLERLVPSPMMGPGPSSLNLQPPSGDSGAPEPAELSGVDLDLSADEVWDKAYRACAGWGPIWQIVQGGAGNWPKGVRLHGGRMYRDALQCIPSGLCGQIIRAHQIGRAHV